VILDNLAGLNAAREAENAIIGDSEPLRKNLEAVQDKLGTETGFSGLSLVLLLLSALLVILGGVGFLRLLCQRAGSAREPGASPARRGRGPGEGSKRVNDANQAAICG